MSRSYGDNYRSSINSSKSLFSSDTTEKSKARKRRRESITHAKSHVEDPSTLAERKVEEIYDKSKVKLEITSPRPDTERVYVLLIDNSSSNSAVAKKLRQDAGYLTAIIEGLDPKAEIAINYFSDHCDGERIQQCIDFVRPDKKGDEIITSTLHHIYPAGGGDIPEAIECALWDMCKINFANAKEKHIILVTDSVAHDMGYHGRDDGCDNQRDWKRSVKEANKVFTSFTIVGTSDDNEMRVLQEKFIPENRIGLDLIDLSSIPRQSERLGMVTNAVLFLIARNVGEQGVKLFLNNLYEKWLKEPFYGDQTDAKAREMITRLCKFLDPNEYPEKMVKKMLKNIFIED